MQWRPFLPKGGGFIQEDLGGYPPIPIGVKQFIGNLLLLAVFQFLNFHGRFEALNVVFLGFGAHATSKGTFLGQSKIILID
jgi:hypothetical protein